MGEVLTYGGVIPDAGVLDFDDSFESCITATLTLFLSNTSPYVLWCNSGSRGSWILTGALNPV